MKKTERKTGTKEWAEHRANLYTGCSNRCLYCYAMNQALRFKRIRTRDDWAHMSINNKTWVANVGKKPGRTMFPTTHDITPDTAAFCAGYLKALLMAGNDVVLVSKPHPEAIGIVLREVKGWQAEWQSRLLFRFTITAGDDRLLGYWEPGAPSFVQRMAALMTVYYAGWRTSVSIEPMLDPANVADLVRMMRPWVLEDIWIGKMNQVRQRVKVVTADDTRQVARLIDGQTDEKIIAIVRALKDVKQVRWKDSIQEVIERNRA